LLDGLIGIIGRRMREGRRKRLILRLLEPGDAPQIQELFSRWEITAEEWRAWKAARSGS